MILLVVGADRVDAGKTTFSAGLLSRTGGAGYKPRAGNDYWFDHDDCLNALADGRLYGKDAARLASAEGDGREPELLNPVHRLWRPSPDGGTGLLGRQDREFVVDRVRTPDGDDTFVVNATAAVPDRVARTLPLADAVPVETVEELNAAIERRYVPAFEDLAVRIEAEPLAVVESYGDVAMPLQSLEHSAVAAVAAVEPGRVRIYPGHRFCRACEVARSSPREGQLEKRVPDVIDYLDPLERLSVPPLSGDDRTDPDRIADAYGPAYDALLEAARSSQ
ncbi:ATPase [Natrialbaceae archaeon AArc-T1-2]|uniref:ATPase n=1 Tax=Natrialbaceae archaeon AArc-T1-2 TaxID=3053904 RepID=UPI00255A9AE9|nr:ATPase [Natrialbaceae archaeon AArc-T1-2]WIV67688.1 ATPase [Natrialbaceae archaeon AArc-T1-2]